jgi:hypothetical protein
MICVRCGHEYDARTVGFKAVCEGCGEYLHSCVNCRLFDPKADRCRSLTTEAVKDKESLNYCEEYQPLSDGRKSTGSGKVRTAESFDALFRADGE